MDTTTYSNIKKIQCCYWSSGWDSYPVAYADTIVNNGHKMINTNGDYYYVRSTCEVVHDRSYYVYWTHGLMPEGYYNFDSAGRMILDSETE